MTNWFQRAIIWLALLSFFIPSGGQARDVLVSALTKPSHASPNRDILHAVARRLKLKLILRDAPFKRRLLMMKNGDIDLMVGILKRPDREVFIRYIEPAYRQRSDAIFFVSGKNAGRIHRYEDLYGLKIGITTGSRYFRRFDDDKALIKDPVHEAEANFKKLLLGRIDAMITTEGAGIDLGYKLGISDKLSLEPFRFNREKKVYVGFSKNANLVDRIPNIEETIRAMIQSGEIGQVYRNYYIQRGLPVPAI